MKIDFYTGAKIYLIFALIFLISLIAYEAYINNNWQLLAMIPFVIILWLLNVEYLAIDYKYHGHDY